MDKEQSLKAIKNGVIAACISAFMTCVLAVLSTQIKEFNIYGGIELIVDALLILCLAYAIHKKSRYAAVYLFVYMILSKIIMGMETGNYFNGLIMTMVILYFYAKAIEGTFSWHAICQKEDATYKANVPWYGYVLIVLSALFGLLIVFTFIFELIRITA